MKKPPFARTLAEWFEFELTSARNRNPRSSLRSFAKFLGISATHFSQIRAGKKGLALATSNQIADRLKLSLEAKEHLQLLSEISIASPAERVRSEQRLKRILQKLEAKRILSGEITEHLSWEHLALLSFSGWMKRTFDETVNEAATFFELPKKKVHESLLQLIELELLSEIEGALVRNHRHVLFESQRKSEILNALHTRYLERTLKLLHDRDTLNRYSVTEFMTIPADRLEKARAIVDECLDSLQALNDDSKMSVFTEIAIHLNFSD